MNILDHRSNRIAQVQQRILGLLPAFIHLYPHVRTAQPDGTFSEYFGPPIPYNNVFAIPARFDMSKRYREELLDFAETTINEYEVHIPFDAPIQADWTVLHDGRYFEIRKLYDATDWQGSKVAVVSELYIGAQPERPTEDYSGIVSYSANGLEISFSATISGGLAPYTYKWVFGDGQVTANPTPVHTYTDEGVYRVRLIVTDATGKVILLSREVTVNA